MAKQRQVVLGGTKTRVQKRVPAIPTPAIHMIYGVDITSPSIEVETTFAINCDKLSQ